MLFDGEPPPRELRDPHGIYAWYRRQFYPAETEGPFDWGRLFGLLTQWQARFNEISPKPCSGMAFMKIAGRGARACNHPLCPSCWHRHQAEALAFLASAKQAAPYVFLRQTLWVKWDEPMYAPMVRLFTARKSRYRQVAYTINMEAAGEEIDHGADEFNGELSYQMFGIFVARKVVRDLFTDEASKGNQTHLYDADGVCRGAICREQFPDIPTAIDRWKELLRHPWRYRRHSLFEDYISHFARRCYPTGRSWIRLARLRGS